MDLAGEGDVKFRFFMDNSSFSTDAEGFGMDNFKVFEHIPYTDTTLIDLTVGGVTIPGFDPAVFDYTYELDYGTATAPIVGATVNAPFYESMVITQSASVPGTATVVVTAEDTNYTGTYTVNFTEAPASTNAYLSDLTVNGPTIPGFDSLTMTYTVTLPFATSAVPPVDHTTSDANATSVQTNATGLPGSTVIVVTAEDGVTTNTYTINFDLEPADTVSTLSALTVNTIPVAGFHPDTLEYTVPVTGASATVDYATTSVWATTSSVPAGPSFPVPSTVEITVTAQDGGTTTYTVHLVAPLSDDATLSDLEYDTGGGAFVTVPGFDPTVYAYTVELPFGSGIPGVEYTTTDANASAADASTGGVPGGTTTVTVTAEDGVTILSYTITWTEASASSNSLLASLEIGGGTNGDLWQEGPGQPYLIQGFEPNMFDYRFYVDNNISASIIHAAVAVPQDPNATVTVTEPTAYNNIADTYTIIVTAEDGSVNTYTIWPINGIGQEELETGSVTIYPNPSTGVLNIKVVESINHYTLEVISTTGQEVFREEYTNNSTNFKINLSNLSTGIYYIKLIDKESGKFIQEKLTIHK